MVPFYLSFHAYGRTDPSTIYTLVHHADVIEIIPVVFIRLDI